MQTHSIFLLHGSLRLYGVSTGCLWRWDLLFNLCSPEIWTFLQWHKVNRVFQDQCIEAIHCLRHVFVATATGRPKSWQGNAVFQTLLQKTLLFLCGSFDPLSQGLFLWLKPREISGADPWGTHHDTESRSLGSRSASPGWNHWCGSQATLRPWRISTASQNYPTDIIKYHQHISKSSNIFSHIWYILYIS